jgi:beta-1,2-mannobiose phosphorylase / 1,2-beta-oligomannan phosphorylase
MLFADTSRRGRPFAKDPAVVRFNNQYLLYYSLPSFGDGRQGDGWAIGIARSSDLDAWEKIGEILPEQGPERNDLCAPGAIVLDGKIHLFYQTYGNGPKDAICHAVSEDGLRFRRNPTNPIFAPTGAWNCGRAIDADVIPNGDRLLLYWATRDPAFKVQMLGVSAAPRGSDFGRERWTQLCDGPILAPELPWERKCIEAPALCRHAGRLFMFYGGGYNNEPQQIGCAVSEDGVRWTRLSDEPFLPNGAPSEWNASESGHPFAFADDDGQVHLFFQGNNDKGQTWFLSRKKIVWEAGKPRCV